MAKVEITPHAKERVLDRISEMSIGDFLAGVRRGVGLLPGGMEPWAIRVVKGSETLGFAVGEGLEWTTTLDGGKTPDKRSRVVTVKV